MIDRALVLVAGMHRCGTSAATRLLNLIGVSLGDEAGLMAPQPDNPLGFWEARDFSRLNDRLLLALGGTWARPPELWDGWGASPALASWREEAASLLEHLRSDGADTHAIKDPRFSLTLPLWRQVAPEARVLVPFRHPLATAQSLHRRNGMPIADGAALWLGYVRSVLMDDGDHVLVDYADLLGDPRATALRLAAELGLPSPTEEQLEAAAASISPDLDHVAPLDGAAPAELVEAEELYRALRAGDVSGLPGPRPVQPTTAPSRPEVVLHIGTETASDVMLSDLLFANRDTLATAGVLYPRSIGGRRHWPLLAACITDDRADRFAASLPESFRTDRAGWIAGTQQKLVDEVNSSGAAHVVLSVESLHSALRSEQEVRRLQQFLAPLGRVRVVLYLARQDRALARRWQQSVQSRGAGQDPFAAADQPEHDYEATVQRWSSVFGDDLVLRSADDLKAIRRDRLDDFFVTARLPVTPGSLDRPHAPEPLSARAQEALLAFDRIARAELPDGLDPEVRRTVTRVAAEVLPGQPGHSDGERARGVVEQYAEANRRVARGWLGRDELFDDDFTEYRRAPEPPGDDGYRLAVHLTTVLQGPRETADGPGVSALPRQAQPQEGARPAILHYHLFKNAGTSLDALFKEQLPGRWETAEFPADPAANRAGVAEWIREHPDAACYSSHTALMPPPDLPEVDLTPVVFLRHPLDRLASAYSFEAQQRDAGFGARLAQNTTMRGYIEVRLSMPHDRQCRNFQTDRLAGLYPGSAGTELERALRAVRELPFVGVVEAFDRSLAELQGVLRERGFPTVELRAVRHNVSRGRADSLGARLEKMAAELGEDFFEELLRANADDIAVHHAACARMGV